MAKTVSQHSTLEEWRQSYNELASDVGDIGGLRTQDKTTLVDAVNDLRDREFFFQGFIYTATGGQTVFEGADGSPDQNVLEFRDHRFLVFKNGDLQQLSTDFTISNVNANGNHTRVTLTSGATLMTSPAVAPDVTVITLGLHLHQVQLLVMSSELLHLQVHSLMSQVKLQCKHFGLKH